MAKPDAEINVGLAFPFIEPREIGIPVLLPRWENADFQELFVKIRVPV
jgi:hypothetical protein